MKSARHGADDADNVFQIFEKKPEKLDLGFFFRIWAFFKKTGKPTQPLNLQCVKWFGLCLGFVFSFKAIGLLKTNTLIYVFIYIIYYYITVSLLIYNI